MLYSIDEIINLFQDSIRIINYKAQINSVSIDSRSVSKGALFIAINGENKNGHDYIETSIKKGANLIICEYIPDEIKNKHSTKNANFIIVKNSLDALTEIARYNRTKIKAKVIGITGNIGKTTVKEIVTNVLSKFFKVHSSQKSFNNHIGLPITLANASEDCNVVVLEMGMNHKGEIEFLSNLAKPNIAIITTIAPVHTEFFNSIEEIALAKAEIFSGMDEDGVVILNQENKYYDILLEEAKKKGIKNIINIGLKDKSHIFIEDYKFNKMFQTEYSFSVVKKGEKKTYNATVAGFSRHSCFSTLFAVGIAVLFKLPIEGEGNVLDIISSLKILEGRGNIERIQLFDKELLLINDSYNASPEAAKSAISSLGILKNMYPDWSSILILGDMLELGKDSEEYHLALRNFILESKVDKLITVGKFTKILADSLKDEIEVKSFEETKDLVKVVRKEIKIKNKENNKFIVLLKASRGFKFEFVHKKLI